MPSMRRMRIFFVLVLSAVVYILYLTSKVGRPQSPDFYSKTKSALTREKGTYHPHDGYSYSNDDDDAALKITMEGRLKDAERTAKDNANAKSPRPENLGAADDKADPAVVENIDPGQTATDRNVAGRKKAGIDEAAEKVMSEESAEDREVKAELDSILKRSPSETVPDLRIPSPLEH